MLRGDVNELDDEDQFSREIGVACNGGGAG